MTRVVVILALVAGTLIAATAIYLEFRDTNKQKCIAKEMKSESILCRF